MKMSNEERALVLSEFLQIPVDEIEHSDKESGYHGGMFLTPKGSFEVLDEEGTKEEFEICVKQIAEDYADSLKDYLMERYQTADLDKAFEISKEKGQLGIEIGVYDKTTYHQDDCNIFKHNPYDNRSMEFRRELLADILQMKPEEIQPFKHFQYVDGEEAYHYAFATPEGTFDVSCPATKEAFGVDEEVLYEAKGFDISQENQIDERTSDFMKHLKEKEEISHE